MKKKVIQAPKHFRQQKVTEINKVSQEEAQSQEK